MEAARPSRTALGVAMRRATHQRYDTRPLVFEDDVIVRLLGTTYGAALERAVAGRDEVFSLAMRAFLCARSRYAEDKLAEACAAGVRQYCLLGAGLDTFAHRSPHVGLRVFEVDHPATQHWKRGLLAAAGLREPEGLRYAPVDFERESLSERLRAAGLDLAEPVVFSWLGVVPYLTIAAFRATVEMIAGCPTGSGVIFDYGLPREALTEAEKAMRDVFAARVQEAGEPFQLFFTPEEVAGELSAFAIVEDLGGPELNERYFAGRGDELRVGGSSGRVLSAWR